MRTIKEIILQEDEAVVKQKLLHWSQQFREVVWLDSNNYSQTHTSYQAVLAADAFTLIQTDTYEAFAQLEEYQRVSKDWLFGYLSYDLKNDVEALDSKNRDGLEFPELFFFQPQRLFTLERGVLRMKYLNVVADEMDEDWETINAIDLSSVVTPEANVKVKLRMTKDQYAEKFNDIINHIYRGDIYEVNFCQEFYAEQVDLDPLAVYTKLNTISNPPFASYLKLDDKYVMSASPERYLRKSGNTIVSQPIKGTSKRSQDAEEDQRLITQLANDEKERAENIMIVDLVRNDLSKTALKGTVKVNELCKVYTFDQVHQMISTVTSVVDPSTSPVAVIASTFPMGSMTGAPKVSAMKIIEAVEETKRGIYSGAVGYFTPAGDFDFNVIIRTILYNATNQYVSYSVGGAITAKSKAEAEYEECLVKAKAMREALLS